MKFVDATHEILTPLDRENILKMIETAGRVCYKSEDKTTEESASKFVKNLISRGHESVIEHVSFSVKFTCDRGISHEIVRHRLASYSQESTRYCNYSNEKFCNSVSFVLPHFYYMNETLRNAWLEAMEACEDKYFEMLLNGATPQDARSVLPNSLKTEIIMTANLREWRHFLKLRTSEAAHPDMRMLTRPLLIELKDILPEIFGDI